MTTYNLFLYREPLAPNVPPEAFEVYRGGRIVIYDGHVYGVNGIDRQVDPFGEACYIVGLFDRSDLTVTAVRQERIDAGESCPVCHEAWQPIVGENAYHLIHAPLCAHFAATGQDELALHGAWMTDTEAAALIEPLS